MCEIKPEHSNNIRFKVGKPTKVLYMKVIRDIYGCIEAALLWYILFTQTLKGMGFKTNPYNEFIANKEDENGKQCTIPCNVDDCIATHAEQVFLDKFRKKMMKNFGDTTINTGNKHDFLLVNIIINEEEKTVEIETKDQIQKLLKSLKMRLEQRLIIQFIHQIQEIFSR